MDDTEAEAPPVDPSALEQLSRVLLVAIYCADLVFVVDLLTKGALSRWASKRVEELGTARRRRRDFARARAAMLFEAGFIVEEAS